MAAKDKREQIKSLLGSGLEVAVVAEAAAVTRSYISQLLSETDFAEEVASLRALALTAATDRDRRIDKLEDALIEKAEEVIDGIYKPKDILLALRMVNDLKRRGVQQTEAMGGVKDNIVRLSLPQVVVNNFVLSRNSEVIEVDGKAMVTMPSHKLLKEMQKQSRDKESAERYARAANYLPNHGIEQGIAEGGASEILPPRSRETG